jgi:uncharacterized NAD(P)/FAD-binding protein YdhS
MVADHLGLSAKVDDDGALIGRADSVSDRIFTVGPLRKGNLWETNAVPELREQSKKLADLLLGKLGTESRRVPRLEVVQSAGPKG